MLDAIRDGLARLGVRRMLLAIHDVSFPSDPDEDLGRGSPATRASARLFDYARSLGFTGIQLGPQGQTAPANPSPYDSTIFSRHIGNISVDTLRGLVDGAAIERVLYREGGRANHEHAFTAIHALVEAAYRRDDRLDAFIAKERDWLVPDALHAALSAQYGTGYRGWPARDRYLWTTNDRARLKYLVGAHERAIAVYAFGQLLAHEEHERVRHVCQGLQLYGDLQVGYSDADAWRFAGAFLRNYLMGAPPSRTNPEGQPWGYPVLDPEQYGGAARDLVLARADKAFREYDSLRIDHPHGLVCPWVYRSDTDDHAQAVRDGARLFASPDLPDHPSLARFAIARPEQLQRDRPRHADDWVRDLDAGQIDRYAMLVELVLHSADRCGRSRADLSCEVLSTLPAPLAAVLARYDLGRWRVTQKANMDDPRDVYRTENAERQDWVMLGNHDTAPILSVIGGWSPVLREKWVRHLTARLAITRPERFASDGFLATAMLAELFVSRAENVSIFFADLFGYEERFNVPGLVDDANWTLRLPPDFERVHRERLARDRALDIPLAVELALAAQEHRA